MKYYRAVAVFLAALTIISIDCRPSLVAEENVRDLNVINENRPPSLIKEILAPNVEEVVDDITSCSPFISLFEKKKISISEYVYIKNNKKECLDSNLHLLLRGTAQVGPSKEFVKALDSNDRKSDTILCREFVELFKLVDLAGLTERMCSKQVLRSVSHKPFCKTTPLDKVHSDSLVETFNKNDLFKIAAVFQFLHQLRGTEGCSKVCSGAFDNAFCNAYVNLTLFFVEETRKAQQPTSSTVQENQSTLAKVKRIFRKHLSLQGLKDVQGVLDNPRLLNKTLTRVFPFISEQQLSVIQNNKEIIRYIVQKAIKNKEMLYATPATTTKGESTTAFHLEKEEQKPDADEDVVKGKGGIQLTDFDKPKPKKYLDSQKPVIFSDESDVFGSLNTLNNEEDPEEKEYDIPSWENRKDDFATKADSSRNHYRLGNLGKPDYPRIESSKRPSYVWHMFKVVLGLGIVVGVVYVCIRNKKKIRDMVGSKI